MFHIDASQLDHRQLNEQIQHHSGELFDHGCLGRDSLARGRNRDIWKLREPRGNALGAYLNGACIEVLEMRRTPLAIR